MDLEGRSKLRPDNDTYDVRVIRHGSGQFSVPAVPVLAAGEAQRLLGTDQR
jgi:hypothetical protein